jgi:hypothetical protein
MIPSDKNKTTECVIVLGNHLSYAGVGDIVYTVYAHFSRQFPVRVQEALSPGAFNIIIDEFTNPNFVEYLKEVKVRYPETRYAIVATEFYTPFIFPVFGITGTFNFFGSRADWRALGRNIIGQVARNYRSYMHRRFLGFLEATQVTDLIISVHPKILTSLERLSRQQPKPVPAANIYPTIDLEIGNQLESLATLPFGFALTGSVTKYRARTAARLRRAFTKAGCHAAVYKEIPFGPPAKISLEEYPKETAEHIFNFNPPQQAQWAFSSPMRLLRAALLGQIPVVTKIFGDHEIERIALLWKPTLDCAWRFWCDATLGRETLVEQFRSAVEEYNRIAEEKNRAVTEACLKAGILNPDRPSIECKNSRTKSAL